MNIRSGAEMEPWGILLHSLSFLHKGDTHLEKRRGTHPFILGCVFFEALFLLLTEAEERQREEHAASPMASLTGPSQYLEKL